MLSINSQTLCHGRSLSHILQAALRHTKRNTTDDKCQKESSMFRIVNKIKYLKCNLFANVWLSIDRY
jgi:hypothetical protein